LHSIEELLIQAALRLRLGIDQSQEAEHQREIQRKT
jgi:hypothetical protein